MIGSDTDRRDVVCGDCEAVPRLQEAPYERTDYVLVCDCEGRQIDVSESVTDSALVEPLTGKWANLSDPD